RMSACGEATGSTLSALCFVALGFTALSMSAGSIGPVKQMIRSLNLQAFRPDFLAALNAPQQDFRNQVLALAADHGIELFDG
ncbi:MAG: peptidase, partial [Hyphomonas sp.]